MRTSERKRRVCLVTYGGVVALFAVVVSLSLPGCWSKKEAPVPPPKRPEPVKLSAIDVLRLMPHDASLALVAPTPEKLYERAVKLVKRLAPDEAAVDAHIKRAVSEAASHLQAPAAGSFADLARAKGLDPDSPVGIFVDITPTVTALEKEATDSSAKASPEAKPGAKSEGPADKKGAAGGDPPATPKAPSEAAASATPKTTAAHPSKLKHIEKEFHNAAPPAVAAVFMCTDPKAAAKFIRDTAQAHVGGSTGVPVTPEESDVEGVHLVSYGGGKLAYFLMGRVLVAGNSVVMLKEVAERFKDPADIRYGTSTFPANDDDQLIALVRQDRLMSSALAGMGPLAKGTPAGPAMSALLQNDDITKAYSSRDPLVVTLCWNDRKVELLTRLDSETHPDLMRLIGPAKPLRLAAMLPASTLGLLSIRFNDQTKSTLTKTLASGLSASPNRKGAATASVLGSMILSMIGDEAAVGVTGVANGQPKVLALVDLANPDQTRGFLAKKGVKKENYSGSDIIQVPVMFTTLYYAFSNRTLAASNDLGELKSSLDLLKAGTTSDLFHSLTPALDMSTPRYSALVLRGQIINDVVEPLMKQSSPGPPAEVEKELDRVAQTVRGVRATQEMKGPVLERRLTVYLN